MLEDRRSQVLKALVEEYIKTGEPVSSQSVLSRSGLDVSSATVRNDLAQLESYGFVTKPHTSAGRIPTHQGYRFYVDHLAPARLRDDTRVKIDSFFLDVHRQISDLLKDTSTFVSDLTAYPAVVVGPGKVPETVNDSFVVSALALEHSDALIVRTSVTVAFARSPMQVALSAWGLAAMSAGRFDLGLGSQIRQNIEDLALGDVPGMHDAIDREIVEDLDDASDVGQIVVGITDDADSHALHSL